MIQLQNQDNVLFGFGTYYQKAGAHREEGDKCVALLFTSNPKISLLQVEAQPALIHAAKPERQLQARVTESIRLNLEQAIFFGATGSGSSGFINPLSFDLCSQASGDLEEVCLQVSDSILRSESKHIHPALDLRIQMSERIGRLNQIITYVNENQAMNLISEAGRWKLCQNVEKMVAGLSLWQYQNSLLRYFLLCLLSAYVFIRTNCILSDSQQMDQEPYLHTLSAGITSFMKRFGVADNAVRLFFKHHLDSLSELMGSLLAPIPRSLSARYSQSLALEIHEVSKIVVVRPFFLICTSFF